MRAPKGLEGVIFVVSGPSGSGKTTLLEKLVKEPALSKKGLVKSISFTTRPKRSGERNARDYFFISEEQFRRLRKAKKFIEWTKYLGYYYATPKDSAPGQIGSSRHVVLCLDLKGALKIKRLYPHNTVLVFIKPPSIEALRQRIERRCSRTKREEVRQRLKIAREEMSLAAGYDYCLLNQNLHQAIRELKKIMLGEITLRGF